MSYVTNEEVKRILCTWLGGDMLNLLIGFTTQYLNDNVKYFDTTILLSSSVACTKQKVSRLIKTAV